MITNTCLMGGSLPLEAGAEEPDDPPSPPVELGGLLPLEDGGAFDVVGLAELRPARGVFGMQSVLDCLRERGQLGAARSGAGAAGEAVALAAAQRRPALLAGIRALDAHRRVLLLVRARGRRRGVDVIGGEQGVDRD